MLENGRAPNGVASYVIEVGETNILLGKHEVGNSARKKVAEKIARINVMKKEYADSFTIHGLSRLFQGRILETIFWSIILISAVTFSSYLLFSLYMKYILYEVYTNVEFQHAKFIPLPALTICSKRYVKFCLVYPLYPRRLCQAFNNMYYMNHCHMTSNSWQQSCVDKDQSVNKEGCITINHKNELSQIGPGIDFGLHFRLIDNSTYDATVMIHDPDSPSETEGFGDIPLKRGTELEIKMERYDVERLPAPYPSKCVKSSDEVPGYIYPGKYTVNNCMRSCRIMESVKKCGYIFNSLLAGIPASIIKNYPRKGSMQDWMTCWKTSVAQSFEKVLDCACPPLCYEKHYKYSVREQTNMPNSTNLLAVRVYYNEMSFTKWKEVATYGREQMMAEFGGLLGLLVGASVFSLIELAVYGTLHMTKKYYQYKTKIL